MKQNIIKSILICVIFLGFIGNTFASQKDYEENMEFSAINEVNYLEFNVDEKNSLVTYSIEYSGNQYFSFRWYVFREISTSEAIAITNSNIDIEDQTFQDGYGNEEGINEEEFENGQEVEDRFSESGDFVLVAKKIAGILESAFDDVGRVGLIMEGTGINHAHIKLFPMHGTDYMKRGEWRQFESNTNKFFEKYEGYLSSNDSDRADDKKLKVLAEKLKKLI